MQQGADTHPCKKHGCQQIPGMMFLLAGVTWPVQMHLGKVFQGVITLLSACVQEAGQLLRGFFLDPQQHKKGAKLYLFHLAIQNQLHGISGFFPGQAATGSFSASQCAHVFSKNMFGHG